jgi:hypothetical protein
VLQNSPKLTFSCRPKPLAEEPLILKNDKKEILRFAQNNNLDFWNSLCRILTYLKVLDDVNTFFDNLLKFTLFDTSAITKCNKLTFISIIFLGFGIICHSAAGKESPTLIKFLTRRIR